MSLEQSNKLQAVIGTKQNILCLLPTKSRLFIKPSPLDLDQMGEKAVLEKVKLEKRRSGGRCKEKGQKKKGEG